MGMYLDFENEKYEKGFKPLVVSRENFKSNIGKRICYVDFVEPHRGTYFVRYGVIHSIRRNTLYMDDMGKEVNINNILECGIEIEKV